MRRNSSKLTIVRRVTVRVRHGDRKTVRKNDERLRTVTNVRSFRSFRPAALRARRASSKCSFDATTLTALFIFFFLSNFFFFYEKNVSTILLFLSLSLLYIFDRYTRSTRASDVTNIFRSVSGKFSRCRD